MKKGRDLLGLPILEPVSGQRLGEVEDLVYDPSKKVISGLLIDKGNWFHPPKHVPLGFVEKIEPEGISVSEPKVVETEIDTLISSMHGKRVETAGGKLLGSVQDVVLDESCGCITGLEVSDGFISDIVSGRAVIGRPDIITENEHVVVVEDKLEKIWEIQF